MSPGVNRSCDAGSESRTVSRAMPDSDSARLTSVRASAPLSTTGSSIRSVFGSSTSGRRAATAPAW